ncbi:MAG: electron transfer flavoprotein subunit beta/FixA family protein [Nitrospirota bacterium]|uniref:Electron transfer flavoprotein, beta subunit n=1 Tax=hydrothermal vent metagenome TaxID=652676 RepID=A0A3B1DVF1_9ZZZZ|nr:electron transfer flavoprotein subunit beta/FixA family protein [Nitrospirota bacterium]
MNIAVCIKQVPATESKIRPSADGKDIDRTGLSFVVNPYDEFGLEEALKIKEQVGKGTVTVISIGEDKTIEALRTCLAVGADQAIHIKDPALSGSDTHAIALVLTAALQKENYDIIFFGKQAIDNDSGAVGIHVAELMNLPHVAVINKLEVSPDDKKAVAHRQIEGGTEVINIDLPAIFTCQKELNVPRYASLPGIMKAKQKPMTIYSLSDLNIATDAVGAEKAMITLHQLSPPEKRTAGTALEGNAGEAVTTLVRLLHEEAKVF